MALSSDSSTKLWVFGQVGILELRALWDLGGTYDG